MWHTRAKGQSVKNMTGSINGCQGEDQADPFLERTMGVLRF